MPSIDDNLRTSLDFRDISLSFAKHPITDDIGVFYNEDAIKRSVTESRQNTNRRTFLQPTFWVVR